MLSGNLPCQPRERSRGQAPPAPAHFGIPRGRIRAQTGLHGIPSKTGWTDTALPKGRFEASGSVYFIIFQTASRFQNGKSASPTGSTALSSNFLTAFCWGFTARTTSARGAFPAAFRTRIFLAQIAGVPAFAFLRPFRGNGTGVFTRAAANAQGRIQPGQAVLLAVTPDIGHRVKGLGGAMLRTGSAIHVLPGNQAAADVKPGHGNARSIFCYSLSIPFRGNRHPAYGPCGADLRTAVAIIKAVFGGKSIRGFMNPFRPSCRYEG